MSVPDQTSWGINEITLIDESGFYTFVPRKEQDTNSPVAIGHPDFSYPGVEMLDSALKTKK
ncbi:hypothetical protein C7460_12430 [Marinoscillum furvescens DSM 4134]|uniref:Uncharacterized protein n=1 Tax=Marinoscillum furvescens DSM 4134 TaxID=1122208 RepID=A0A3D9KXF3_MARFU|nr:hypothetical protein C7460_12430 [Marinoscillum furvescens DSM 4134]